MEVRIYESISWSRSHRMQGEFDSAYTVLSDVFHQYDKIKAYFINDSLAFNETPYAFLDALTQGAYTANQMGATSLSDSLYTRAENLYEKLIALHNKDDSLNVEFRLKAYEALSGHYSLKGWAKYSIESLKEAMNLFRELNKADWKREKRLLRILSYVYEYDAQYDSMKKYVDLRFHKELVVNQGDTTDEAILCYPLYGEYHAFKHQYDSALYCFRLAHSWAQKNTARLSNQILYFSSMGFGNLYQRIGDYPRAVTAFNEALGYTQNDRLIANTYESLSTVYLRTEEHDSLLSASSKFLSLRNLNSQLPDDQQRIIDIYVKTCRAYLNSGKPDSALSSLEKAVNIFSSIRSKSEITDWYEGQLYQTQGYIAQQNFQYEEAIESLENAISKYTSVYGPNYDLIGECYIALGQIAFAQEKMKQAKSYANKALNTLVISEEIPSLSPELRRERAIVLSFPFIAQVYDLLGDISIKEFQTSSNRASLNEALTQYKSADDYLSRNLSRLSSESSVISYRNSWHFLYEKAIQAALLLWRIDPSSNGLQIAYDYAEKSKAHLLRQSQQDSHARIVAGLDSISLVEEKSLKSDMAFARAAVLKAKKEDKDSLNENLFKTTNLYFNFVKKLEKQYPRYYQLKYNLPTSSIKEIQESLSPTQAFLQYFEGDTTLYQFIVLSDTSWVRRIPKTPNLIQTVDSFQQIISVPPKEGAGIDSAWARYRKLGYTLFQTLYEPIMENLKEKSDVKIVPDGILMKVPTSALLTQADFNDPYDPPFFIHKVSVSYDFSGTTHVRENTNSASEPLEILGVTPDFSQVALPDLERTPEGLKKIEQLVEGKFLVDKEATKANVEKYLSEYGILYFATHAQLDTTSPLFSNLAFTPTKPPVMNPEQDFLYAYELYNYTLKAELTILGACETGIGTYERSEGMISLGRAFAYAGCPSLVMSLWKAQDIPTALNILPAFVKNLSNGHDKARALQEAKIDFLKESKENKWKEDLFPYAWATFISVGNQSPLKLAEPVMK